MMTENWVFGYGSLMWKPGFDHIGARPALLRGAHRQLCVYSYVHRGTPERPGLVMGLDWGGACRGVAYQVADENWDEVVEYLRAREQVTMVYRETHAPIELAKPDKRKVRAMVYMVDRSHEQYAGMLSVATQLDLVRGAVGQSGENPEYVLNTVEHMRQSGIRDPRLEELADLLIERDISD
jgi:cation transport protein ChaC